MKTRLKEVLQGKEANYIMPFMWRRSWVSELNRVEEQTGLRFSVFPVLLSRNRAAFWAVSVCYVNYHCPARSLGTCGYTYRSAFDHSEWVTGCQPTFGLIAGTQKARRRTVKASAWLLDAVARATALSINQSRSG